MGNKTSPKRQRKNSLYYGLQNELCVAAIDLDWLATLVRGRKLSPQPKPEPKLAPEGM
jgi:hypothetical protein